MIEEPKCYARDCKHVTGLIRARKTGEVGQTLACKAFPKGIPEEIAYGKNDHTKPYKGDNGIQFEKGE